MFTYTPASEFMERPTRSQAESLTLGNTMLRTDIAGLIEQLRAKQRMFKASPDTVGFYAGEVEALWRGIARRRGQIARNNAKLRKLAHADMREAA